ncbi:aminotransferase (degT family) [Geobacillus kaustophilus HTA426]|uniref:Aminotransferase (DegT family) n=1 Tax=Geobacillus kaustophilus (strain HTA426) TaxID=235909 RepID=Q5KV74_GEOKA|nr:LegC family aminotransferase [Geobacillus kaustophilus]MED4971643.1 LegC family aminotransferase [Geobacillus thermoleovorans]QCK81070.1 LegC family aminotransferase [Geobacillus kaustophilus NBRC 102445]WJQ13750.1 LegC family aminotransferase [Geobacillus stearothermophilus]BAD77412.1 aminotransferase (degT family) [Geobacillus kaustophilus HTA426]
MSDVLLELAKKIKNMCPEKDFIPLHEPTFTGNEKKYVADCIETGWVSSVGKYVDKFERLLAEFTGVKRAVAVVNGTAALHIALKIVGVQPNDEVLIPSLTFVATGNAVVYCGAVPHFVDVSKTTLGIDPFKLEDYLKEIAEVKNNVCVNKQTNRIIRAIVPMHTFGHPVDLDPLLDICERWNLIMVEDAAESLGSYYKGIHTGNFGKASAMSFNGNKIITTGGGGAILTNDEKLADYAKHLTTTAKLPHRWKYEHDEIGYNYRMPNINAALGCAQFEHLEDFIEKKRQLVGKYEQLIEDYDGIKLFKEPQFAKSNYWLQTLIFDEKMYDINQVLDTLNNHNVMARPVWKPLHLLNPFQNFPKSDLSVTEQLQYQIVNVPSSPYLGEDADE